MIPISHLNLGSILFPSRLVGNIFPSARKFLSYFFKIFFDFELFI